MSNPEIKMECHCKTLMKKSSGTGLLFYYCPNCKNKVYIHHIDVRITELFQDD